jgi:hypothetical protein
MNAKSTGVKMNRQARISRASPKACQNSSIVGSADVAEATSVVDCTLTAGPAERR